MRVTGIVMIFCVRQGQKRKNSRAISSILDEALRKKARDYGLLCLRGIALSIKVGHVEKLMFLLIFCAIAFILYVICG